jgi:DNA-binding transcriptional ArsR family regulator
VAKEFIMTGESIELVAARFKVLSEPVRLRILQSLEGGEKSVGTLAETLETTQPNVSKHLRILQDNGFVSRRHEGNSAYYAIADPCVYELCDLVCSSLRDRLTAQAGLFKSTGRR